MACTFDIFKLQTIYKKKHADLLALFSQTDHKHVYETIIYLGKTLKKPPLYIAYEENLVPGCQSTVYLAAEPTKNGIYYHIQSDALISSGLAMMLLKIYQNESAAMPLCCPPQFIQDLGLQSVLSPGRSNGLASIYAKIYQDAKKIFLLQNTHLNASDTNIE